jgi:hypothetical protein
MLKQIDHRWQSMAEVLEELNYILPTVEAGPRDLISELSVGLSEQKQKRHHRPDNAGAIGQRRRASAPPPGEAAWGLGSARPVAGTPAMSAGRAVPQSPPPGGRTAEFSRSDLQKSAPGPGSLGNEIALAEVTPSPRKQPKLHAVRESKAVAESRMAQATGPKTAPRHDLSAGPRTNVFEDLGEQLSRGPGRSPIRRPRRESPWSVILPLAFAILLAAAAGYGLLVRAGINEIRGGDQSTSQPVQSGVGQRSVIEATPTPATEPAVAATSATVADSSAF